jgi:hypothetical protein
MSYDPSHRMPPRQERWPAATPAEGWPSYRDGEQEDFGYAAQGATAGYRYQAQGAVATAAFPAAGYSGGGNGYAADDFDGRDGYGQDGYARDGYARSSVGYAEPQDGYAGAQDGYAGAQDGYEWASTAYAGQGDGYEWSAPDGYPDGAYLGPGSYVEPGAVLTEDPALTAPDAGVHPDRWQAEQERRREAGRRGPMVGAVTVLLATGVVLGVSTLAAAVLKSATSPVGALAAVFAERTPAALRNAVVHHFGAQGRTVLLLGMYVTFAVVAIVIGALARRDAAAGVAGVAAFALFAAFVAITRPASHVADVIPVVIGGLAGVAAAMWLFRASAPQIAQGPLRHGRGGSRRRTR